MLALVTGQRRSDIAVMKKSNVKRNPLLINQYKAGAKIALPVKLECKKMGMSLRDIIDSYKWQYCCFKTGRRTYYSIFYGNVLRL